MVNENWIIISGPVTFGQIKIDNMNGQLDFLQPHMDSHEYYIFFHFNTLEALEPPDGDFRI